LPARHRLPRRRAAWRKARRWRPGLEEQVHNADGVPARDVPVQRYNRAAMLLIAWASRGKHLINPVRRFPRVEGADFAAACFLPCHRTRRRICLDADNPVRGRPGRQLGGGS